MGYREGIERGYRRGPRLPECLSFSNLVELCRTFQMLYGSMCSFYLRFLPINQPRCALGIWTSNISALIFRVPHSIITAGARWLLFRFPTRAGHLSVPSRTGPLRCAFAIVFHMLSNMKRQGTMVQPRFPTCGGPLGKMHCALRNSTSEMCACAYFQYAE